MKNILWPDPRNALEAELSNPRELGIEMSPHESAFLCGLLRAKRPAKILEIGVSAGGSTAVILKAVSMLNLPCRLYSIDVLPKWARDTSKDTGYVVQQFVPELRERWKLYLGRVASIPLREIGPDIDFCVIDTMHITPGEVLDFLVTLPYLKTGAVVLLHDTARHYEKPYNDTFHRYATSLLFSSVVADKLTLVNPDRPEGLTNLSAFIINDDTHKYIVNVFLALAISWAYLPPKDMLEDFMSGMFPFYSAELMDLFIRIVNMNLFMRDAKVRYNTDASKKILLNTLGEEVDI